MTHGKSVSRPHRIRENPSEPRRLLILIGFHSVICCVSLAWVSRFQAYIPYSGNRLGSAALIVAAFSMVALLFVIARFSFGYFVGFYLYTMVLGFLWIVNFTKYNYYNHARADGRLQPRCCCFCFPPS